MISAFLSLSFGIPFACVLLARVIDAPFVSFILFGIQAASPSIAAVLVVFMYRRKKGLRQFLEKAYRSDSVKRLVLFSLAVAMSGFLLGLLSKILYRHITDAPVALFYRISGKQMVVILWALIAEELGWRGFLQDELKLKCRACTPMVVGGLWAAWHYHFYWVGTNQIPAGLFLIGCVGESYVYAFLKNRMDGNIIAASLWHCIGNLVIALFAMNPGENEGTLLLYAVYTCMIYVLGIVVFFADFGNYRDRKNICLPNDEESFREKSL